jgi:HNH endonuclease
MTTEISDPTQWRLDTLLSLSTEHVHDVARVAAGSLTSLRLVLGRCLLALDQSKGHRAFACSSAIHYAIQILGLSKREARTCRRVARELLSLPDLSLAAELGTIGWSKLREIVRKADAETESYWLELAHKFNSKEIQALVARTPKGSVPGELAEEEELETTELRCPVCPRVFRMLAEARRLYSIEQEEAVTNADILEMALASYIAGRTVDADVLEKARLEADKDLQAREARRLPLVQEARDLAEKMGLLGEAGSSDLDPKEDVNEVLAEALGGQVLDTELLGEETQCACDDHDKRRPTWVAATVNSKIPNSLKLSDHPWENSRLRFNPLARLATKAQRREILRRDSWCCQTPGCPNKIWLHLHHVKSYGKGGKTVPQNLISLCSGCHRNLHAGHLQITLNSDGKLVFTDHHGERLDRHVDLEFARWLDRWHGWRGKREDSHYTRVQYGLWKVVA